MSHKEFLRKHYLPVPVSAIHHDAYGRVLVARAWLKEAAVEEPEDTHELPTDDDRAVPPEKWVFDECRKTVKIGKYSLFLRGKCQFKLLKYVCSGGSSAADAWQEIWGYTTPVEYDTLRNTVRPVNMKLQAVNIPVKIEATTRILKISEPTDTESEAGENG